MLNQKLNQENPKAFNDATTTALGAVTDFVGVSEIENHKVLLLSWLHSHLKNDELSDADERAQSIHHYELFVSLLDSFQPLQDLHINT